MDINCILNDTQPLHKGRDSSPHTQNVGYLRTRSCTALTPPPSLPTSRDFTVTEAESTGMLGETKSLQYQIRRRTSTRLQSVLIGGQYVVLVYQNT